MMLIRLIRKLNKRGSASLLVLAFGVVASLIVGGLVIMTSAQYSYTFRSEAFEQALIIAESGINYYRWHLAHDANDYQDGTGGAGPYVHDYKDPEGGVVGKFSLEITPPDPGYSIITITSTGWTTQSPTIKRSVRVRFGVPSYAKYSFMHNANVWFGQGLTVHGRALSNGGIRQDGVNDSVIQSAKETYTCGSETGCSPSRQKPGVWGSGGPSELWEYPVPPADFAGMSVDFNTMRDAALDLGTHFAPSTKSGYHLVFLNNGTVNIYEVNTVSSYKGYDSETGCTNLYQRITSQSLLANYNLTTKNTFFLEDTVWIDGVVNGRVMVAAARFPIDTYTEDVWINGNITYLAKDGNHNLGIIAQRDIYFAKDIPTDFEVDAALVAQKGRVIRHNYGVGSCGSYSNRVRNSLTMYGSLISNKKSYWNWGSPPTSGFITRGVTYDNDLFLVPPPYFPSGGDYEFISWEEDVH